MRRRGRRAAQRALAETGRRAPRAARSGCAPRAELDIVTALSGSGPAYFFLLAEQMAQAAEALGLERDTARAAGRARHCTAPGCWRMAARPGRAARRGDLQGRHHRGGAAGAAAGRLRGPDRARALAAASAQRRARRTLRGAQLHRAPDAHARVCDGRTDLHDRDPAVAVPDGGAAAAAAAVVARRLPQSAGALDRAPDQSGHRAAAPPAAGDRPPRHRLVRGGRRVCAAAGVGVVAAQRLRSAAGADLAAARGVRDSAHHAVDLFLRDHHLCAAVADRPGHLFAGAGIAGVAVRAGAAPVPTRDSAAGRTRSVAAVGRHRRFRCC